MEGLDKKIEELTKSRNELLEALKITEFNIHRCEGALAILNELKEKSEKDNEIKEQTV